MTDYDLTMADRDDGRCSVVILVLLSVLQNARELDVVKVAVFNRGLAVHVINLQTTHYT